MTQFTILHNPRCSKSRQTLALLEDAGITPTVVPYLDEPPTVGQLGALLDALDAPATDIIRFKEARAKDLGISATDHKSRDEWLALLSANPKLIERPIVVKHEQGQPDTAVIGRPPENVNALLS